MSCVSLLHFFLPDELKFKATNCQPVTQKFNICSPYNLRALSTEITSVCHILDLEYLADRIGTKDAKRYKMNQIYKEIVC